MWCWRVDHLKCNGQHNTAGLGSWRPVLTQLTWGEKKNVVKVLHRMVTLKGELFLAKINTEKL
eukprot:TRINITY_DN9562_c0_g1_i1.p3 TRINITY_DN9562_c0_g1~~TRINITY_DN9562_c0_g1_i1.p3  ORF type:complete len:63 (+),score=3.26 TRINITY_DN9562_c0_g1_i1:63-251(+)